MSPEVQRIIHTACFSAVVGGIIGALGRGRIAHMNFLRSNAHEVFETPLQAKVYAIINTNAIAIKTTFLCNIVHLN